MVAMTTGEPQVEVQRGAARSLLVVDDDNAFRNRLARAMHQRGFEVLTADRVVTAAVVRHEAMGFWWANVPKERWPDHPEWRRHIAKSWDAVYGDRRQEIVFIGTDMDEAAIRRRLDACLVGDANAKAMQPAAWRKLKDPFPIWKRGEPS